MPPFPRWPILVSVLGLTLVAADLVLVAVMPYDGYLGGPARPMLALLTTVLLAEVSRADRTAGRSAFDPAPGWAFWAVLGVLLGAVVGVLAACAFAFWWVFGCCPPEMVRLDLAEIPEALYRMCLDAPLVEEVIYRQALCGAVVSLVGPRTAIGVSGIVFAGLHWLYGNPSVENQVGGFLLAWMYLRSGTLIVPILFHSVGNFGAMWAQIFAGYLWPVPIPKGVHI